MSAVVAVLYVLLLIVLITAVGNILRRVVSARKLSLSLFLFLILPVGQLLILYSFSFDSWSVYWLLGSVMCLAANALILLYAISQERKSATIEELREVRHRIALERSHYEAAQKRREELDEICEGFIIKLDAIAKLARLDEFADARERISALANKIDHTKENKYCDIPVINAVLTQKETDCETAGIVLSVELNLPTSLGIEPMHLCSVFSNILDNAIAACSGAYGTDKPIIRLSSKIDGDYLFIKATNPSDTPKNKAAPGRGLGHRILSEITEQYGGGFHSGYRDGTFTVIASLLTAGIE